MFLNKIWYIVLFFSTICLFGQTNSSKKDSIVDDLLDEVVVTATRTKRMLSKLPMQTTLVSKKDIAKAGSTRLRNILLEQTGIVMVTDFGNSEGVQLQGLDAEYTLILIDGLPIIGRTAGNIDLNRLSIGNIKQIEVVKGASSSLYGSEAMGGVINIITEKPKTNQTNGDVSYLTRFGAKNELDINGNFTHKKGKVALVSSVNLNSSNGFDLTPETLLQTAYPHQNITGNVKIGYDISDKLQLSSTARYYYEELDDSQGKGLVNDANLTGKITYQLGEKSTIESTLYGTKYKTKSIFNNKTSVFDQSLFFPEIKVQFPLGNSEFIGGVGARFDALERTFFDGKEQYNSQFAFAQYDTHINEKFNLILGVRFDHFNKFKSAFSPKLAMRYEVNDWLALKSSVGFGYKVPSFRQLFFNFRNTSSGYIVLGTQTLHELYGNVNGVADIEKELKPESSIGYNFGFQLKPTDKLNININAFRNDISDLIDVFDTQLNYQELNLPQNTRTFSYRNISKVFTQGIELDANYKFNSNITFSVGYQFLDTGNKDEISKIKNGEVFFRRSVSSSSEKLDISNYFGLPNRSKHTANAKLFYENYTHDFSVNIRALFRSKYALFDTNNNQGIIDDFDNFVASNTQVNMAIGKTFFKKMNLQIGVDNLFNNKATENIANFGNLDTVLRLGRTFYSRIQFNI